MAASLPIESSRERILDVLAGPGSLVLTAPTGAGKSTGVPRFLFEERRRFPGRTLVLQPRRIAARSLAARVASETRTNLGGDIGYQVRFDSRCGPGTAVVFQTYGVFVQQMLANPALAGVGAVLLDEFHERTLECDLALAWLKALRQGPRPDLRLGVLSATMDPGLLLGYLPGASAIDVPARSFPVDTRWLAPESREDLAQHALRALRSLAAEGLSGSVLVFMPGMREIRRTVSALGPFCRERGLALAELHGSMELSEQSRVLDADPSRPCVVVSTNVAETSLTIPGVAAVIDSGLHRIAAYSPGRDVNTLYVGRVSRGNAAQRAGRAGRTGPGRCVRLWAAAEESSMAAAVPPEMARLELSGLCLQAGSLPGRLDWLTPPRPEAWSRARALLEGLGAADREGSITAKGRALLRYPAAPRLAAVLDEASALDADSFELVCAMTAVFESQGNRRQDRTLDLLEAGKDLLDGRDEELPWEASEILRQLRRLGERRSWRKDGSSASGASTAAEVWIRAFKDRLASRRGDGLVYVLDDGRKALLPMKGGTPPELILALEIRETAGGGQTRQVSVPLYLPCEAETVRRLFPGECAWKDVSEFDEKAGRVVHECRLMMGGLVLEARAKDGGRQGRSTAAGLWAERFAKGELRHPGLDDRVRQLVTCSGLARKLYTDLGFPEFDSDDWRLVFEEVCKGKNSLKAIEGTPLEPAILGYLGPSRAAFLDKVFPVRKKLASGKIGRFTYHESKPAELSARLGDFVGMKGKLFLCEGRLAVVFDILAPNMRTVQKTSDLTSFWVNAYPQVKKELQRRYPKHPWP
ncbi:MAG: ATP-dependent helicase C-terminal domain-containing protein [Elusimicrobiota bacterium]|jgi:ATP-dependent helicase HrpB